MRKKATRVRPYFTMESVMTAILRGASGKMHHGILFDFQKNTCHFGIWCTYFATLSLVIVLETKNNTLLFVGGNFHCTIEPEYQ